MSNLFKKGKIVLVLFLCFMVFGITNVYAEESINEVSVTGIKNPAIGDKVADIISDIKVSEGASYTIDNITWWESENGMYFGNMSTDSVFQDNSSYYYIITLKANDGYVFASDENNEYTGSATTADSNFIDVYLNNESNLEIVGENIIFGDLTYKVIEGANQTYVVGESTEAKFVIDADYSLFEEEGRVIVDENEVAPSNYEATESSTVITLKKDYVDTLSEGEHSLFVIFSNYKYAETTFNVTKNSSSSSTNTTTEITPPNTGIDNKNTDNYNLFYVLMLSLGLNKLMINTRKKYN